MTVTGHEIRITDNLDLLLGALPQEIREPIQSHPECENLVEIVLDLGREPEARFNGHSAMRLAGPTLTREMLQYVAGRVGVFGKDNRAGIERTLHRISAIRNRRDDVVGLTLRVGRAVFGTVSIIRDVIESGQSVLLLGRPGIGKTTLLREAARVLSDEMDKRVVVVDTSNEIAGDGDIPHPGIGRARRMQVPVPELQHAVMIEAVENHMPEIVVIDEIGTEAETIAARTIAERGVQLIATAHGKTLDNLIQNPTLCDLIGGIQAVTLSDEEANRRGTQKTVLERKAPPTFSILVEIQEKDRFAVHLDVAKTVDQLLRGTAPHPQIRAWTDKGEVRVTNGHTGEVPASPSAASTPTKGREPVLPRKVVRIYPYAVSRNRLDRAIRELRVPATVTDKLGSADLVLILKSQEKRQPKALREAVDGRGLQIHLVRSNTFTQIEAVLKTAFALGDRLNTEEAALREVEEAIAEVMSEGHPVELAPQSASIRQFQHQLIVRYGLTSESKGNDPSRRIVIYPPTTPLPAKAQAS